MSRPKMFTAPATPSEHRPHTPEARRKIGAGVRAANKRAREATAAFQSAMDQLVADRSISPEDIPAHVRRLVDELEKRFDTRFCRRGA